MPMAEQVLMTAEGLEQLKMELEERKTTKRKEIKEAIKVARGYGDLSENSEYDEAKDAQAQNELRIAELEETLKHVVLINENSTNDGVSVGSKVKVYDIEFDEEVVYKIVGSTEADPAQFKISNESPVGSALLGHKVGDKVTATTPMGVLEFEIREIVK
ncbi:MAG: transcription elongation factor GreA [Clostridia bacterium]|nr:transcription elongation factor GreA [Clostridia bacterium]